MAAGRGLFVVDEDYAERCREAMEKAGRFLSVRARTEQETRERLSTMGFEAGVVDQTTTRLIELGLLDDLEFAKQWVGERSQRKSLGPRALRAELVAKGVPSEVIDQAIAEVGPEEEALAIDAASRWAHKVARFPLPEQAHKLQQMLLRKGFSFEAAEAGTKAVLPPEGWD